MKKHYQRPFTLTVQVETSQLLAGTNGNDKFSTPEGAPGVGHTHEEETPDDLEIDAKENFWPEW